MLSRFGSVSELLGQVLSEMQACGLTNRPLDQGQRQPRAEGEPQTGEQRGRQIAKDEVIYLGDRT